MKNEEMKKALKKYYGKRFDKAFKEAKKTYPNERGALNSIAHEVVDVTITGVVMGLQEEKNRKGSRTYLIMSGPEGEYRLNVRDGEMDKLDDVEVFKTFEVTEVRKYIDILKDREYLSLSEDSEIKEAKEQVRAKIDVLNFGDAFNVVYEEPDSDEARNVLRNVHYYYGEITGVSIWDKEGDKSVSITIEDMTAKRVSVKVYKQVAGSVEPDLDYLTELMGMDVDVTSDNREFIKNMLMGMPVVVRGKIGIMDSGQRWLSGSPAFGGFVVNEEAVDVEIVESELLANLSGEGVFRSLVQELQDNHGRKEKELLIDAMERDWELTVEQAEKLIQKALNDGLIYEDVGYIKLVE